MQGSLICRVCKRPRPDHKLDCGQRHRSLYRFTLTEAETLALYDAAAFVIAVKAVLVEPSAGSSEEDIAEYTAELDLLRSILKKMASL